MESKAVFFFRGSTVDFGPLSDGKNHPSNPTQEKSGNSPWKTRIYRVTGTTGKNRPTFTSMATGHRYIYIYKYIPGSSRYVKFMPFGRFFFGEKAYILHTWKIQVYIHIDYIDY